MRQEYAYSYFSDEDNRFQPAIEDGKRPHLLIVRESNDVRVRNLHFHNSSDWNIWVRKSSNVHIDAVDIYGDQRFPNNDGIEPDSCVNLTISNSRISVADDGISPISSVQDGPLRNLHVFNTTIRSKSHAIKFVGLRRECVCETGGQERKRVTIVHTYVPAGERLCGRLQRLRL